MKNIRFFICKLPVLVVKCSIYLNRRVFVMFFFFFFFHILPQNIGFDI